jgi:FkbM family methyltransferase
VTYVGLNTAEGAFVVSTADRNVGRSLLVKRSRPEFRVLRLAVGLLGAQAVAGRTLVDIGANIGTTTISALRSHGFGAAICCEPEEENFRLLEANLALNGVGSRAQAFRVAVSSEPGRATLVLDESSGSLSWIARGKVPPARTAEVEVTTLDRLAADGVIDPARVALLWIDTEGHEGYVLKSAGSLLERGVPVVMELDSIALATRGDPDLVHDLASEHYTYFVDVRRQKEPDGSPKLERQPVSALRDHADRLRGEDQPHHTDVLLLRSDHL